MSRAHSARLASLLVTVSLITTCAGCARARAVRIGTATMLERYPLVGGSIFDPYRMYPVSAAAPREPLVAICSTGLKLLNLRTGERRQLSKGYAFMPVWSPDGSHIACVEAVTAGKDWYARTRDWQVRVIDIRSGSSRVIGSAVRILTLAWTSNTKLAWRSGQSMVVITDVITGRHLARLKPKNLGTASIDGIAWSQAGDKVVIAGNDGQGHDLVNLVDLRTSAVRTIARHTVGSISWSPDGKWVALRIAPAYGPQATSARVVVVPVDGGSTWQIDEPSATAICWSPRSDGVLLGRSKSGVAAPGMSPRSTGELFWVPLRGRPQLLRSFPEGVKSLSWAMDRDIIVDIYGTIWRLTVD